MSTGITSAFKPGGGFKRLADDTVSKPARPKGETKATRTSTARTPLIQRDSRIAIFEQRDEMDARDERVAEALTPKPRAQNARSPGEFLRSIAGMTRRAYVRVPVTIDEFHELIDKVAAFPASKKARKALRKQLWKALKQDDIRKQVYSDPSIAKRIAAKKKGFSPACDLVRETKKTHEAALLRLRALEEKDFDYFDDEAIFKGVIDEYGPPCRALIEIVRMRTLGGRCRELGEKHAYPRLAELHCGVLKAVGPKRYVDFLAAIDQTKFRSSLVVDPIFEEMLRDDEWSAREIMSSPCFQSLPDSIKMCCSAEIARAESVI